MTYEEQLKDERWKYTRELIISRDLGICQQCMSSKNLNVHHTKYIEGKMAWEYPHQMLITLCQKCHEEHHKQHGIEVTDGPDVPSLFAKIYQDIRSLAILDSRINGKR